MRIISPAVVPLEERPPVPTEQERVDQYNAKRGAKLERKKSRIQQLLAEAKATRAAEAVPAESSIPAPDEPSR